MLYVKETLFLHTTPGQRITLCLGLVCRGPWLNSVFIVFYFILLSRGGKIRTCESLASELL
jgi:hypothetical protein